MAGEALGKMGEGVDALKEGKLGSAAWDVVTGGMDYTLSPVNAALRTIVGKPIEENTRGVIKKEWPEFAASLALPGIGLARTSVAKATAKEVEKVFSPSTVSPLAQKAAGDIRASSGTAARESATTEAALEPFHAVINKLPEADRYQFIDFVESRSSGGQLPGYMQSLQPIADTMATAFEQRMMRLQSMPSTAAATFIEDYFPHMWKDPTAARNFAQSFGGAGKQGSGASLRKRTVPTIADGIAAGLEPVTSNPIEATLRYTRSMDHFIAAQEVLDAAKAQGTVRYIRPKVMGASGNPDSYKVPPGFVALKGRGATNAMGAVAHAPEDWARVYNNYISKGFYGNAEAGKWYDAARQTSNAITSLELGLSGFHAFTMANEAIVSGVAKGIQEISKGRPIAGVGSIVTAPAKPMTNYLRGRKVEQVYLGRSMGNADMRKITELLEKAGGRAKGASHAVDYQYSAMGSFWNSWQKGSLKLEAAAALQEVKNRPGIGTAKVAATLIGRTMSTIAAPLFEKYIPRVKNGAFYDTMASWLKSHPGATQEEELTAARKIWDSIDNRFGEMVQDNLFWNKMLQQSSQLAMRSYSWNVGTVREIGGGVLDLSQSLLSGKELSERAAYVVALPITVAALNATYQYLKTGKAPEDVRDLVAGRTGGEDPDSGVPERIALPGYQKDILGWHDDWTQEIKNKSSGMLARGADLFTGKDWRGDPIRDPNGDMADIMQQYFDYAAKSFTPIALKNQRKEGSNISRFESILGLTPARRSVQDPEGMADMRERIGERGWQTKLKHDERDKARYGGPVE